MGVCFKDRENEVHTRHKPIPLDLANKVSRSICKITIKMNEETENGTGFFMNISNSKKCLITNYHVINSKLINESIEIEIWNHKKMKLNLNNYNIKYFELPKDITVIQIKNTDKIYKDIEFLDYDRNYINGYKIYKNADIFSIQHPCGKDASCASGRIIDINDFEFDHDISTDKGSSGCPIILLNNNIDLIQVIGIHKFGYKSQPINGGTFIGEIFKEINEDLTSNIVNNNYIISEIFIKYDDINKKIRIINSYEEYIRNKIKENPDLSQKYLPNGKFNKDLMNEEEIKNCEIKINNKLIPFNYFYKFEKNGKYEIKYSFKKCIVKTLYLFDGCKSITNINLSNFNTQNITNIEGMFSGCESLKNIDFSNFNTKKVTNMKNMFYGCASLKNIDLSNFNTQNVTNMEYLFGGCESLTNIDLYNFNTQNVTNMNCMFFCCTSLTNIDISNFNTQNVTNMAGIFNYCKSLTNLDLSNFNTQNVINMNCMFFWCISLTNVDLSNFNTQNVINMKYMFEGCKSLKKEKVITNDNKIFQRLKYNINFIKVIINIRFQ